MIYNRKIYSNLLKHAQSPLVTVLTGMRRTGKTTLVRQLLNDLTNKNSIYLDLQRPDNQELFSNKNYDAIIDALVSRGLSKNETMIVALDEIQLVPEIPSVIKYLYDNFKIKFIVTGSSSYYLKNLFSESLAGRKKIFELYPLDFGEFLTFKEISYQAQDWQEKEFDSNEYNRLNSYYGEYVQFGGFPQVVLAQSQDEKRDILLDIMSSYVNIDIRSLADFSDERNLYSLAKLLSSRVGSKVDYSKLSRLTGISRPTITNYISFFEKTYLINLVSVHTSNHDRAIVKSQKLYFCDTGLANVLAELSSGSQFENTVYGQLSRSYSVKYFALKDDKEIDFVVDEKLALETKETPVLEDLDTLAKMSSIAKVKKHRLVGRNKSPNFVNYIWAGSIQ